MAVLPAWEAPDTGSVLVVSGPTGVGKSTLLRFALDEMPGLAFSVSATTRPPRKGESEGVDYHFLDEARFAALVADDAFLEHATVYDKRYGTLRQPIDDALARGESVVLDIDAKGAAQVRERMPEAVSVIILAPDTSCLSERLRGRGMPADRIAARMAQVAEQLAATEHYDYLVVNDDLATAQHTLLSILVAELSRTSRRTSLVSRSRSQAAEIARR